MVPGSIVYCPGALASWGLQFQLTNILGMFGSSLRISQLAVTLYRLSMSSLLSQSTKYSCQEWSNLFPMKHTAGESIQTKHTTQAKGKMNLFTLVVGSQSPALLFTLLTPSACAEELTQTIIFFSTLLVVISEFA